MTDCKVITFINQNMKITFEHTFIPRIVDNSNRDEFELDSVEIFDSFEFVQGCFSDNFPKAEQKFDWKSFSITKEMNLYEEHWLLRFPEATEEREAKWGLILHKAEKPFKYYLCERCADGTYVTATYEKGEHKQLAPCPAEITGEDFVKMVLELK